MINMPWIVWPLALALLGAAVITPVVIQLARRVGAVAQPRADRWHRRPTALLGGVAIYLACMGAAVGSVIKAPPSVPSIQLQLLGLATAATVVFILGLVDDLRNLSPSTKVVGQTLAACLLVLAGIRLAGGTPAWLAVPLTVLWVVGITNAVNLLDNMDGVVAGVVAIAAVGMATGAATAGHTEVMVLALCLAGACSGFLLYNFHPARIFMGDCGSLFLGFTVSALALIGSRRLASNLTVTLLIPVALLAVPIFDTTLVSVARWLHGRPLSQGGRDHTTHRLVALGMSERGVALFLYTSSTLLTALGLLAAPLSAPAVMALAGLLLLILGLFGVFLGMVQVYPTVDAATAAPSRRTLLNAQLIGKRALVRVMLDVFLVPLAVGIACLLRFDGSIPDSVLRASAASLPVWIAVKVTAMVVCRTHHGLWRYTSVADVLVTLKASTLGSFILGLLALVGSFRGLPQSIFVLDWLLFTALAVLVRTAFVFFQQGFATLPRRGAPRVLVVGADEHGIVSVRRLRQDRTCRPVGFVDDDRGKHGGTLEGLPVMGEIAALPRLVREREIEAVIIPKAQPSGEQAAAICRLHEVPFDHDPVPIPFPTPGDRSRLDPMGQTVQ